MMRTVLITGIAGFVGSHLAEALLRDNTTTIVGVLHPTHKSLTLESHPRVTLHREDVMNISALSRLLQETQPQEVYHLAGMAHVHESWNNRRETIETNFMGSFNLLEECRRLPVFPKVLLVGSAECYGIVPAEKQPITEASELSPASPYSVSKIAQEMLGIQYARGDGFPVFLTRSFNHTGPRQKETFVCSAFARQIAESELDQKSGSGEIRVGNLVARRDFTDVRDVVRAYITVLEKGQAGIPYNVCSGKAYSIEEILKTLVSFSKKDFNIIVDHEKFRPVDMPLLLGSSEKLRDTTGWKPEFDIKRTLRDLLDYWRKTIA